MPSSNIAEGTISSPLEPLAVTLGDPASIGPELVAKAWERRHELSLPPFFALGDRGSIAAIWHGPVAEVSDAKSALIAFNDALPMLHVEDSGEVVPGAPTVAGAHCAMLSLELGVGLARAGEVSALVTGPISKAELQQVGFTHPGQTEFIAERCGIAPQNAIMMLAGPGLRVFPITVHVPFRAVPDMLSVDLIVSRTILAARGLARSFGIENPRLAIAGLNPHAGENGMLGQEEIEIIIPAVDRLRAEGLDVTGPYAPDAMFTPAARSTYDAAMCLYHDQGLIPLKTLHFDEGVNATLGLPIVRTSPDHGTAFGIAGTDRANPGAMIAAIQMAAESARFRFLAGQ